MFEKILNQERTPVYTLLSLLTTVLVEAVILMIVLTGGTDSWARLGEVLEIGFVAAIGFLVNCVLGAKADTRGEYLGGRIALLGIAPWALTAFAFWAIAR